MHRSSPVRFSLLSTLFLLLLPFFLYVVLHVTMRKGKYRLILRTFTTSDDFHGHSDEGKWQAQGNRYFATNFFFFLENSRKHFYISTFWNSIRNAIARLYRRSTKIRKLNLKVCTEITRYSLQEYIWTRIKKVCNKYLTCVCIFRLLSSMTNASEVSKCHVTHERKKMWTWRNSLFEMD